MAEETVTEGRVLTLLSRMEERQEAGFEQVNTRIQVFRDSVEVRFNNLEQRTARLEGGFEQMDRRMGKIEAEVGDLRTELKTETGSLRTEMGHLRTELKGDIVDLRKDMRQVLFVIIGTWVTIMLTLLLKNV